MGNCATEEVMESDAIRVNCLISRVSLRIATSKLGLRVGLHRMTHEEVYEGCPFTHFCKNPHYLQCSSRDCGAAIAVRTAKVECRAIGILQETNQYWVPG